MSLKIEFFGADDLGRQITQLDKFDAIARKHWRVAMSHAVAAGKGEALARVPVMSGRTRDSIKGRVSSTANGSVTGRVTAGAGSDYYPNVVEYGRHKTGKMPPVETISARMGLPANEAFLVARSIAAQDANARKPAGFMAAAKVKAEAMAEKMMDVANDQIVKELAVD